MYESFYGLTARPFQLNPDPKFFFRSTGHKRAQSYMRYGLQQEQGFIVVTGDVGTGKTMLVNNLFKEIEHEKVTAAKIVSSNVKDVDLLRLIAAEFDIPFQRASKAALLHNLEERFKEARRDGRRVLLVIDEAQNLPRSALEELRMLSNFDMGGVPLVQSFLLGQREFRTVLRAPGLEQLRQRVIAAYHLKPLTENETKKYIDHRLSKAGWQNDPEIDPEVYTLVFESTGGVPRRVNTLFDRLLLNGYLEEQHRITADVFHAVASEFDEERGDGEEEPGETGRGDERPTVAEIAPAPRADNIAKLEERIREMQATINSLSAQLQEARTGHIEIADLESKERFPLWTAAFTCIAAIAGITALLMGYWVLA